MAQRIIERFCEVGSTVGATTTVLKAWAAPAGSTVRVEAIIVGRDTGNGDGAYLTKIGNLRVVSGTLSVVGSILDLVAPAADTGLALASATIAVNGSNVEVRVAGVAARTIEWMVDVVIRVN